MSWTTQNLPSQRGKTVLITGANTGIGFHTALELARKEAHVIVCGRSEPKVLEAVERIQDMLPKASLEAGVFDLASLHSIRSFCQVFHQKHTKLDLLINNAGVMCPPAGKTLDGFELQFGINFIGHYALTALLFDLLKMGENTRIVTLSSIAHKNARIDFHNLKLQKTYDPFREYGQSKIADLIFAIELQRRISAQYLHIVSVGAHPGISKTELQRHIDSQILERFDYMSPAQGALSTLFAATDVVDMGGYYGPDGQGEVNGYPAPAYMDPYAQDANLGKDLWEYAQEETKIKFPL